jgi:predicted transcriptional regulator
MKLASDNETLAENKALILYLLSKVNEPLENTDFYKLVLSFQNMNYFYFQQFLLDLIDNKYILKGLSDNNKVLYELTSDGKEAVNLVQDLIPGFIKFQIDNNLKEDLHAMENERSVTAEFIPQSENSYTVVCKIIENNNIIFEIKTFAGSRDQAKMIVDNWKSNAETLYPNLLELLIK